MTDTIDEVILSALSKDAKLDINELWECLKESGHNLTMDEIECRIKTLRGRLRGGDAALGLRSGRRLRAAARGARAAVRAAGDRQRPADVRRRPCRAPAPRRATPSRATRSPMSTRSTRAEPPWPWTLL